MKASEATEYAVTLESWNCAISVLVADDGVYIPLRQLCGVVGVADAQQQAEQLQARRATQHYMRKLPIMTGRGRRLAWCIHKKIVGYWLGYLNEKLVRPEIVDNLIQFQEDVISAAEHLLFRDTSIPITLDDAASSIIPLSRRLGPVRGPVTFPEDNADE